MSNTAMNIRTMAPAVIRLSAYRDAVRASRFLAGCFHGPPAWLNRIAVEVMRDGTAQVVVLLNFHTDLILRAIPRGIDGVKVLTRDAP